MPADGSDKKGAAAFAKHKSAAIRNGNAENENRGAKMSLLARFLIFVFVPSFTGLVGLGTSYLQSMRNEEGDEDPHEVDFDRDFVTPFLLSLALVIVLGFQTNGFSGEPRRGERRGPFVWPKARKVQKIRRERVIVEDDDATKKEQ